MSIRYTLRLETNGAEVWKRWTGDQREAADLLATALVDLGRDDTAAGRSVMAYLRTPEPGVDGMSIHSRDFSSTLTLTIKQ